MRSGVGTGPTNISWNGPYRASRFPLCCPRFALHREWRRGMRTAVYLRVSTNRQTQAQTIEQRLGKDLATSPLTKDSGYVDPLQSFSPVSSPNNHGLAIFQSRLKISGDIPRTGDDGS